ncbi:LysR family transcriptional regulator [Fluviicoccus keumensis]|uniref:LysR family transcriptional regulator n=1 Tax=Fluviicoccus keumensis TaxID=1435465 RepID=A0A4V2G609_9GAMM|nr:LysR family transcriptional regulator [Fluviicoccus keumensis]RZU46866.1 LysR family transcriptional regulator [Fluviicoccus keumensis]
MNTADVLAFIEVARTESFSQAAERLFLTQPAISKRVSNLEESLGVQLFDRVGRRVQLTEAGRALLPRARQWLLDFDDIRKSIADLSGPITGVLRIGTSHHIGLHRLPPTLRRFSQQYPDVRLDIQFIDSEEAYESVLSGDLELGIVTLPPVPDARLLAEEIWDDPLAFVAGRDHPLASKPGLALPDLTSHPAILPSLNTFTRQIAAKLFQESHLELNVTMATNYLETIRMMVSIGLGWSVLPASMANEDMVLLPLSGVEMHRSLGVVYHPRRTLSRAAGAMLEMLRRDRDAPA